MPDSETHVMAMVAEHEGTEEWACPVCGRRLLIEWHPWRRVVMERGDEYAAHSASKGLQIGGSTVIRGTDE